MFKIKQHKMNFAYFLMEGLPLNFNTFLGLKQIPD